MMSLGAITEWWRNENKESLCKYVLFNPIQHVKNATFHV